MALFEENPQRLRPSARVKALAERIIGTTGDGHIDGRAMIDVMDDFERWELRLLDTYAFACTGCGWWFAAHERKVVDDEWFCSECEREGRR